MGGKQIERGARHEFREYPGADDAQPQGEKTFNRGIH